MADKLTTSKTLSGEEEPETTDAPSQANIDAARDAAGGVGDATDWNHAEGEADPLFDPYKAPHEGHEPAPAKDK